MDSEPCSLTLTLLERSHHSSRRKLQHRKKGAGCAFWLMVRSWPRSRRQCDQGAVKVRGSEDRSYIASLGMVETIGRMCHNISYLVDLNTKPRRQTWANHRSPEPLSSSGFVVSRLPVIPQHGEIQETALQCSPAFQVKVVASQKT